MRWMIAALVAALGADAGAQEWTAGSYTDPISGRRDSFVETPAATGAVCLDDGAFLAVACIDDARLEIQLRLDCEPRHLFDSGVGMDAKIGTDETERLSAYTILNFGLHLANGPAAESILRRLLAQPEMHVAWWRTTRSQPPMGFDLAGLRAALEASGMGCNVAGILAADPP